MLCPAPHIRYHIAAILVVDPVFSGAVHWLKFVTNTNAGLGHRDRGIGILE